MWRTSFCRTMILLWIITREVKCDRRTSYWPKFPCLTLPLIVQNDHSRGRDLMRQFFYIDALSYFCTIASTYWNGITPWPAQAIGVNKCKYLPISTMRRKPCVKLAPKGLCIWKTVYVVMSPEWNRVVCYGIIMSNKRDVYIFIFYVSICTLYQQMPPYAPLDINISRQCIIHTMYRELYYVNFGQV